MEPTLESYDALPYPADPVAAMHPDRLAVLGRLHGLATASPDRGRVLELGCSDGGNLIPLALAYPDSSFLGVDLSRGQIDAGRAEVDALGLTNLELRHASILDVTADDGPFDYLLCHGVYSWVPAEVQRHILTLAAETLTAEGVAYVSYNAYPGWAVSGCVRQALRSAASGAADPTRRIERARSVLALLERGLADDPSPYARQVLALIAEVNPQPDFYLAHEYLEDDNEPLWFRDFVGRAAEAGLHYLAEANPTMEEPSLLPLAARRELTSADRIEREQTMDLLRNRRFRQTLLARRAVRDEPDSAVVSTLWVASELRRQDGTTFGLVGGSSLNTTDADLAESLTRLESAWPRCLRAGDLPASPAALLSCWRRGLIELHVVPPRCGPVVERPRTCPWLRRQAARGASATDLRHRTLDLDRTERLLIPLFDGSRDAAAVVEHLAEQVRQGRIVLGDGPPPGPGSLRESLAEIVAVVLRNLARMSLLVA